MLVFFSCHGEVYRWRKFSLWFLFSIFLYDSDTKFLFFPRWAGSAPETCHADFHVYHILCLENSHDDTLAWRAYLGILPWVVRTQREGLCNLLAYPEKQKVQFVSSQWSRVKCLLCRELEVFCIDSSFKGELVWGQMPSALGISPGGLKAAVYLKLLPREGRDS